MTVFWEQFLICLPGAGVLLLLMLGSALFSGSETALFYLSRDELRKMQSGTATEQAAAALLRNSARLLSGVLLWNLVINLTYFTVSLIVARKLVTAGYSTTAGVFSISAVALLILAGEVIPKSLAAAARVPLARLAAWPLTYALRLADPILQLIEHVSAALIRLSRPNLHPEPFLQTEDLERALDSTSLTTELAELEQKVLQRLLEISDMTAEELMRPRNLLDLWEPPVHLEQVLELIGRDDYIYLREAEEDSVYAVIPVSELAAFPDRNLEKLAEEVVYVPWCSTLADTFALLRAKVRNVAVVVNEYGEMVGVVTEGDILETVLDPGSSRTKRIFRTEPVQQLSNGKLLVHGLTTSRDLADFLNIDYDIPDDSLLTVSGMLQEELGRFPEAGDSCEWQGFRLVVVEAGAHGTDLRVEIDPQAAAPPGTPEV